MPDHASLLATKLVPGTYGAIGGTPLSLSESPVRSLWQIAGWGDFDKSAGPVLQNLGLGPVTDYRTTQTTGDVTAWRIAPDRILIRNCKDLHEFATDALAVLDLSHARTGIIITGPDARGLLSKLCAVDVAKDAFLPGQFIQTGMHHIGVLVQAKADETFEILVPVTWAETLWEVICLNAAPYGYEVGTQ